jgi:hypothetical protein
LRGDLKRPRTEGRRGVSFFRLRSEPDDTIRLLIAQSSNGGGNTEVPLYRGDVDYDGLVSSIFESDRVISWW